MSEKWDSYIRYQEYQGKTILALDYGEKVIGSALFTPGNDPYPLTYERIIHHSLEHVLKELEKIIKNEEVRILVIGVPKLLDGKITSSSKRAMKFLEICRNHFGNIEVLEQDETLSTYEAKSRMENSPRFNFKIDMKMIDIMSALVILEDFIKEKGI